MFEYLHEVDDFKLSVGKRNCVKAVHLLDIQAPLARGGNKCVSNLRPVNFNPAVVKVPQIGALATAVVEDPAPMRDGYKIARVHIAAQIMKHFPKRRIARSQTVAALEAAVRRIAGVIMRELGIGWGGGHRRHSAVVAFEHLPSAD